MALSFLSGEPVSILVADPLLWLEIFADISVSDFELARTSLARDALGLPPELFSSFSQSQIAALIADFASLRSLGLDPSTASASASPLLAPSGEPLMNDDDDAPLWRVSVKVAILDPSTFISHAGDGCPADASCEEILVAFVFWNTRHSKHGRGYQFEDFPNEHTSHTSLFSQFDHLSLSSLPHAQARTFPSL